MNNRRITLRQQAERDMEDALAFYLEQAGPEVAHRLLDALEQSFTWLSAQPEAGSARYALELDLPGLRFWPVKGFPYLIFYQSHPGWVDVWRVLHAQRHLPETLRPSEETGPGPV